MTTRRPKAKINIPMCAACVLLCLTLFSFYLCGGFYARYTANDTGSDSARVITFGELTLTEEGDFYDGNKLRIIPGVDLQKKATVDFAGSEAATYVFVEITPAKWVTTDNKTFSILSNSKTAMQWSLADGWVFLKLDNGTYVYYRELAPNTKLDKANIIANDGKITVSEYITRSEMPNLTGISIKFRASVVQAGGFEKPVDAWNAIAAKED